MSTARLRPAVIALLVTLLSCTQVGTALAAAAPTPKVESVSAAVATSCALVKSGPQRSVRCWGSNYYGQLGDGTRTDSSAPVEIRGLSGVSQVANGGTTVCALDSGRVLCWGADSAAEWVDGLPDHSTDRLSPTDVGLSDVRQVSVGGSACAVLGSGAVYCWGKNTDGQLGDGTRTNSGTPVPVRGLPGPAADVSVGGGFACARLTTGQVYCWGNNLGGQLGTGSPGESSTSPQPVRGLRGVTALTTGTTYSCALLRAGSTHCWGVSQFGTDVQLDAAPVALPDLHHGVRQVSSGHFTNCAIAAGRAHCWGANTDGAVGNGTRNPVRTPVPVTGLGAGVQQVSAGTLHSCALARGAVYCWGDNTYGQLGVGAGSLVPVRVRGL